MKCPKCQAENREGAEFCGDCGQSLRPSNVVCPQCGNPNPPGKKLCDKCGQLLIPIATPPFDSAQGKQTQTTPSSFANGRYQVKKFLGEEGKKKVYLAHDTTLDRDVAFALIKTEKLDESGLYERERRVGLPSTSSLRLRSGQAGQGNQPRYLYTIVLLC